MEVRFEVPEGHVLGAVVIGDNTWAVTADAEIPGVDKLIRQMLLQAAFPEVGIERQAHADRLLTGPLRRPYKRKTA